MRFGVSLRTLRSSLSVLLSLRLLKRQMDLGEYAIAIGLVVESVSRMGMIWGLSREAMFDVIYPEGMAMGECYDTGRDAE